MVSNGAIWNKAQTDFLENDFLLLTVPASTVFLDRYCVFRTICFSALGFVVALQKNLSR